MIFSNKIYKIESGNNPSLYINNEYVYMSFYNKSLVLYTYSKNNLLNCVFYKKYNYQKLIKINDKQSCICYNNEMRIINNEDL
jgi:hypothetical protein